jgi:hypothetical protein
MSMQQRLDASEANFSPLAVLDIFLAVLAPALQRQDPQPWLSDHLTGMSVLTRTPLLDRPHNHLPKQSGTQGVCRHGQSATDKAHRLSLAITALT